eukprot:3174629-Pleurochrysis_carterae.AAC.1
MNVWRTGSVVHATRREKVNELFRQELPCVVAVQGTYYVPRLIVLFVQQGGERCHKTADVRWGFAFILEEVDGLKTSVVVDQHEQILVTGVMCSNERPSNVRVYQTSGVGWLVQGRIMGVSCGVSGGARRATVEAAVREGSGRVGGEGR